MPRTARRLHKFTESVIREMTRVADAYGAINLSQGYPDFDPPEELLAAAERALRSGYNQYSVTWGSPRFRKALAEKQSRFMGLALDPDAHITVTCGSTEAMMASLMAVLNPKDRLIAFSPFYENYGADAILSGADPIFIPLYPPKFEFDPDELRRAFQAGARALVLCNPSNPTGKVFTPGELEIIASLAQEFDAFIVTDEVYEHIVYPPHRHTYIASLPGMFERTISCSSLSKTYAITGWRLGYAIAAPQISEAIRKVHDYLALAAPSPLQEAAVTALEFPDRYYQQLLADYTLRRDIFLDYLDQTGLAYTRPEGAYYVMVDISPFDVPDDTDFCTWLAKEIGVAAVPGSSFFAEPVHHFIRLNFAKQEKTLHTAGRRLLRLKDFLRDGLRL
jgi:aspartate/methionine/tyrosine aminotransferase